jgi:hypothetical protein
MKTRRDFLAALGLGAGASVLGLPGMAQACGGRWRRARGCCSECGGVSGECGCSSAEHHERATLPSADHHERATLLGTGTTGCICACPQYLYFQVRNNYYYYCNCCDTDPPLPVNSSTFFPPPRVPIDCKAADRSYCFGTCASISPGTYPKFHRLTTAADEPGFHVDPDDVDPKGNVHAKAFIEGIDPKSLSDLNDEINGNDNVKSGTTIVSRRYSVVYDDPPRYVALYDVSWKDAPKACLLRVGFEIVKDTTITTQADDWQIPSAGKLKHYHRVFFKSGTYHVLTRKGK